MPFYFHIFFTLITGTNKINNDKNDYDNKDIDKDNYDMDDNDNKNNYMDNNDSYKYFLQRIILCHFKNFQKENGLGNYYVKLFSSVIYFSSILHISKVTFNINNGLIAN